MAFYRHLSTSWRPSADILIRTFNFLEFDNKTGPTGSALIRLSRIWLYYVLTNIDIPFHELNIKIRRLLPYIVNELSKKLDFFRAPWPYKHWVVTKYETSNKLRKTTSTIQ